MCIVLSSTISVGPETAMLREPMRTVVFEEQQDFQARPIVDAGSHYQLVRSYPQGNEGAAPSGFSTRNSSAHFIGILFRSHKVTFLMSKVT